MKIGYIRISKNDGSQSLDLQRDAMKKEGVEDSNIYEDKMSGNNDNRPGLDLALKVLRKGDTLVVWKIDRLGRRLIHLVSLIQDLEKKGVSFKAVSGGAASIDTSTLTGKLMFNMLAVIAEFERGLIIERTSAGLEAARARGSVSGPMYSMTPEKLKLIVSAMKDPNCVVRDLCKELKISPPTLYRYVSPEGEIRPYGEKMLNSKKKKLN